VHRDGAPAHVRVLREHAAPRDLGGIARDRRVPQVEIVGGYATADAVEKRGIGRIGQRGAAGDHRLEEVQPEALGQDATAGTRGAPVRDRKVLYDQHPARVGLVEHSTRIGAGNRQCRSARSVDQQVIARDADLGGTLQRDRPRLRRKIDLVERTEDAPAVDAAGSGNACSVHRRDRLPQRAGRRRSGVAAGRDDDRRRVDARRRRHARRDERGEQRPDDEARGAAARTPVCVRCHRCPPDTAPAAPAPAGRSRVARTPCRPSGFRPTGRF